MLPFMSTHKPKHKTTSYWLYGTHAAQAALANPERNVQRIMATRNAAERLEALLAASTHTLPKLEVAEPRVFERQLGADAVHQGIALLVAPLQSAVLEDFLHNMVEQKPLLLLDQVTDPHNIGAILRSAAAFDAGAVILTERAAPGEGGVMAKAACGAIEVVPLLRVVNLSQTVQTLKEARYWVAGLDGEAEKPLHEARLGNDTALVLGAEGRGLRRLTAERCDLLVKLPIAPQMESLNVSNAAAVALYELRRV